MHFRKIFSNTHMRCTGLIVNNEVKSYSHKYIFLHTPYAIYQTHEWYPWIVFNPLMKIVLPETRALNWNINVICLWIYSRNICPNILWQFEEWWMYRDSCTSVQNERWSPWHEIYSIHQFMGYGFTEHDMYPKAHKYLCDSRNVYCPSFFQTGWLISTDSIDLVNVITTMMERPGEKIMYTYQVITFMIYSNTK